MKQWLAGCTLALGVAAQAGPWDLQIERTVRNVAAVQSWAGELEQKGLYGNEPVVAELAFRRPHELYSRVTAPAALAGTVARFEGSTLTLWYPQQDMALVLRNFNPGSPAGEAERIAVAYNTNVEQYFFAIGGVQDVAGLPALSVEQRARNAQQLFQSSLTRVYDNYSFPLAGELTVRGGGKLSYRYRRIAFNRDDIQVPPAPALPPSAMVLHWDLAWPARTDAEVAARLPRAPAFPPRVAGLARERLLLHPESLPAAAAVYRDDAHYLLVFAARDTGFRPLPQEYGIRVPLGRAEARLVPTAVNSHWQWRQDGLAWEVLSNLHPETLYRSLLEIAGR